MDVTHPCRVKTQPGMMIKKKKKRRKKADIKEKEVEKSRGPGE